MWYSICRCRKSIMEMAACLAHLAISCHWFLSINPCRRFSENLSWKQQKGQLFSAFFRGEELQKKWDADWFHDRKIHAIRQFSQLQTLYQKLEVARQTFCTNFSLSVVLQWNISGCIWAHQLHRPASKPHMCGENRSSSKYNKPFFFINFFFNPILAELVRKAAGLDPAVLLLQKPKSSQGWIFQIRFSRVTSVFRKFLLPIHPCLCKEELWRFASFRRVLFWCDIFFPCLFGLSSTLFGERKFGNAPLCLCFLCVLFDKSINNWRKHTPCSANIHHIP